MYGRRAAGRTARSSAGGSGNTAVGCREPGPLPFQFVLLPVNFENFDETFDTPAGKPWSRGIGGWEAGRRTRPSGGRLGRAGRRGAALSPRFTPGVRNGEPRPGSGGQ